MRKFLTRITLIEILIVVALIFSFVRSCVVVREPIECICIDREESHDITE